MSGYTVVNLLDLPDNVGERSPHIEGRFARGPLESRDLGISHWRYAPSHRSAVGHRHSQQEEAYVVVGGSGRILLDGEPRDLRQWDAVRVAPEVMRAFEAGPDGLELLAIGGPRPESGDGEMAEVQWPEG
jgi:mannose-6-phosphate isomerase-like protein (cupin superfamily)